MRIEDIMNVEATRIPGDSTIVDAVELISRKQVSDLMVVDEDGKFLGVLSEGDVIRSLLPDYEKMIGDQVVLRDAWRIFLENGRKKRNDPIAPLVIRSPITVKPDDELLGVAAIMVARSIRRLPVVDGRHLVGTVSRSDICRGALDLSRISRARW